MTIDNDNEPTFYNFIRQRQIKFYSNCPLCKVSSKERISMEFEYTGCFTSDNNQPGGIENASYNTFPKLICVLNTYTGCPKFAEQLNEAMSIHVRK
jgi:hypothetical protein